MISVFIEHSNEKVKSIRLVWCSGSWNVCLRLLCIVVTLLWVVAAFRLEHDLDS